MADSTQGRFRAAGELIAAAGVVLSLVFVGLEIRQSTAVARAQARQDLAQMSQDFTLALATNPETFRAFASVYILGEDVEQADRSVAQNILIAWMRRAESAFLQYQEGLLDRSALSAYGIEDLVNWSGSPAFRRFWEQRRGSLHPDFVAYFEQLTAEG